MIMIIVVLLQIQASVMNVIETILVALAVFFTIVSGVDYIVKNKAVLKG